MPIPDAVRATVLRRMQDMTRGERSIVVRASAIGQRFDFEVLSAISACRPETVRNALGRACALQLIVADDEIAERYAFRHAITREILIAEMIAIRTRPLHRRIVRALESRPDSFTTRLEDLAYHSWAAGDRTRTCRYNEIAGDDAAAIHATSDARAFFVRARSLLDTLDPAFSRLTKKIERLGDETIRHSQE